MEIIKEILESIVAVIAVSLLVVTGLVIAMLFELLLALGAFLWIPCLILGALGWLYVKTGAVLSKGKSSTSMSESEMPALTESVKDLDIKM
jgi:hypothetical protein